jgi:hypothetical protein
VSWNLGNVDGLWRRRRTRTGRLLLGLGLVLELVVLVFLTIPETGNKLKIKRKKFSNKFIFALLIEKGLNKQILFMV